MKKIFTKVEVLGAITALHDKLGMPPTIKELQKFLGIGSTRTILRYLRLLEKDGSIIRYHGARGIKFLKKNADGWQIDFLQKHRLTLAPALMGKAWVCGNYNFSMRANTARGAILKAKAEIKKRN